MATQVRSYDDEIDDILLFFGGDAHAAIQALLADRERLLDELTLSSSAMSVGYARGWKPTALMDESEASE